MAILEEYEEEVQKKSPSSSSSSPAPVKKPYNAVLDVSNPLGFVEAALEFVASETDLFKSDSVVNDVNAVVKQVIKKINAAASAAAAVAAAEEAKKKAAEASKGNGKTEEVKSKKESEDVVAVKEKELKDDSKVASDKVEETKDDSKGPRVPNRGNGLDFETHSWTQTLQEANVTIPVPPGTKSRFVVCEIKKNHLKVGIKGQPPIIDGELCKPVKPDDCFWSLEDQKSVSVLLTKLDQMDWWKCLVKGEPEVDTQKVEPETSKMSDLDPETRSTVEKMMFDQRQKTMGRPTSDEMQKEELMKKFMAQHPDMDFSNAKIM